MIGATKIANMVQTCAKRIVLASTTKLLTKVPKTILQLVVKELRIMLASLTPSCGVEPFKNAQNSGAFILLKFLSDICHND